MKILYAPEYSDTFKFSELFSKFPERDDMLFGKHIIRSVTVPNYRGRIRTVRSFIRRRLSRMMSGDCALKNEVCDALGMTDVIKPASGLRTAARLAPAIIKKLGGDSIAVFFDDADLIGTVMETVKQFKYIKIITGAYDGVQEYFDMLYAEDGIAAAVYGSTPKISADCLHLYLGNLKKEYPQPKADLVINFSDKKRIRGITPDKVYTNIKKYNLCSLEMMMDYFGEQSLPDGINFSFL